MLKVRIIPILTFNGFALVKTKQFQNPRMVGNPVQAARVYNVRGVDELIFLDIFATKQNRKINLKVVKDVLKECFMPVGVGGGIQTLNDINDLLQIGADKVIIKSQAIKNPKFIKEASDFFGSQCICISVDVIKINERFLIHNDFGKQIEMLDFINDMRDLGAGEILLNSVLNDGIMSGFDLDLIQEGIKSVNLPIVCIGGGGSVFDFQNLFSKTKCEAVGASSIFHFTQYTPLDIKLGLKEIGKNVRI
jgi:cyclase